MPTFKPRQGRDVAQGAVQTPPVDSSSPTQLAKFPSLQTNKSPIDPAPTSTDEQIGNFMMC